MRGTPVSNRTSVIDSIRERTQLLIAAKESYNALIEDVDIEFTEKLAALEEGTVHMPLSLAKTCITALTSDRSLLPEVIQELKQLLSMESLDDEDDVDIEALHGSSRHASLTSSGSKHRTVDALGSDDDSLSEGEDVNFRSVSLDVDAYINQYEVDGNVSIDGGFDSD